MNHLPSKYCAYRRHHHHLQKQHDHNEKDSPSRRQWIRRRRCPYRWVLLLMLVGGCRTQTDFLCIHAFSTVSLYPRHHQYYPNPGSFTAYDRPISSTSPTQIHLSDPFSPFEDPTTTSSSAPTYSSPSLRRVARMEQFARLPVWPVWMGVILFLIGKVLGGSVAATLEDVVGGRVCPNFFREDDITTSPFIMLVHHRHSFASLDPIRWFQRKYILPEGFPAHPHRGFTTLTYFLKGGFSHRDSLGVAQSYGKSSSPNFNTKIQEYHSQWLFTGAGLLHEEMFNDSPQQELFQLWVNVPSTRKLDPPTVNLLGDDECPHVILEGRSRTVVLAGTYVGGSHKKDGREDSTPPASSTTPIMSEMSIFHVTVEPGQSWSYRIPPSFETVILYIRQGSCEIDGIVLPVHHTAYLEPKGDLLRLSTMTTTTGVDFLLLAGKPLRERVVAQGSMVMNTEVEINQAYRDYQMGRMGMPWSHELSDEEWKGHVNQYPSGYRYSDASSAPSTTSLLEPNENSF